MKKSRLLLSLVLCMSMLIGGVMSVSATDYTNITEESTESSAQIELNIEIDSTFTVGIPISADIDSATGQGAYQVSVKGDIDPRYKLVVAPVDGYTSTDGDTTENINFLLSDTSNALAPKADVIVGITGAKTEFICTDITPDSEILVDYSLTVQEGKLSAGTWGGTIKYTISLEPIDNGVQQASVDTVSGNDASTS